MFFVKLNFGIGIASQSAEGLIMDSEFEYLDRLKRSEKKKQIAEIMSLSPHMLDKLKKWGILMSPEYSRQWGNELIDFAENMGRIITNEQRKNLLSLLSNSR
jgi:serine kinase of HPr protein (carbohydrate metabolism regulator)